MDVMALAEGLNVTAETIRRDLTALERAGVLRRVHGGAIPVERIGFEPALADPGRRARSPRRSASPRRPSPRCRRRARSSSTPAPPPPAWPSCCPVDRELTVVVNSPVLAAALGPRPNLNVLLLGGRVRGRTLATVDDWALRPLADLYVDVAFMGTNGCSVERGLTTPDPAEAAVKRAMIAAARRAVLLADHTKIGNDYLARFGTTRRPGPGDHRQRARRGPGRRGGGARASGWCGHDRHSHPESEPGPDDRDRRARPRRGDPGRVGARRSGRQGGQRLPRPAGQRGGIAGRAAVRRRRGRAARPPARGRGRRPGRGADRRPHPVEHHPRRAGRHRDEDQRAGADARGGRVRRGHRGGAGRGRRRRLGGGLRQRAARALGAGVRRTLRRAWSPPGCGSRSTPAGRHCGPRADAGAALVKPNRDELAEVVGTPLRSLGDVVEAAERLRGWGAGAVLASLGADGAVLVDEHGVVTGESPVDATRAARSAPATRCWPGSSPPGRTAPSALAEALAWGAAAVSLPGSRMPGPDDLIRHTVRLHPRPDLVRRLLAGIAGHGGAGTNRRTPHGTARHPSHRVEGPIHLRLGASHPLRRSSPMATSYTPPAQGTGVKARIQRVGGSPGRHGHAQHRRVHRLGPDHRAVHPDRLAAQRASWPQLVDPMITVLLPILIGYTGGRLVHGQRGAVVGAVATMGVVVGADVPMFLGAMIIGPLTALPAQAVRRPGRGPDPARLRDAGRQLLRRHHRRRDGAGRRAGCIGPVVELDHQLGRRRRRLAGRQQPAAARLGAGRAGQGAVPQQRDQPRRAQPARRRRGRARPASRSCS